MAGELAKTSPLAHVVPIVSLPHNRFSQAISSAMDKSLRVTLPSLHPVLAGLTSAAISLSYSAFVKCAILPMYLLALMRRRMLLLMVGSHPTPLSVAAMVAQLMIIMILGRFARGGRRDMSPAVPVQPYGFADDRAKELPATPTSPMGGYFDAPTSPGGGLGRKTSILKKVRGVVYRGSK